MDESDDNSASAKSDSEPEPEVVAKKSEPKKQEKKAEKKDDKKKGKKGKKVCSFNSLYTLFQGKQADEDEDLDAILADLEKPVEKLDPKKKEAKESTPAPTVAPTEVVEPTPTEEQGITDLT